jgi:hypothetical protein
VIFIIILRISECLGEEPWKLFYFLCMNNTVGSFFLFACNDDITSRNMSCILSL